MRVIVSLGYNQVKKKFAKNYTKSIKKTRSQSLRTGFSLSVAADIITIIGSSNLSTALMKSLDF